MPSTGVVPTEEPSIQTVTVLPGSAVPVIGGVASSVTDPFTGAVRSGAAGAVVSIVKVLVLDATLVF